MRTIGAAKQIARGDDDAEMAKAAEILKETRRQLYGILAEDYVSSALGGRDRARPP